VFSRARKCKRQKKTDGGETITQNSSQTHLGGSVPAPKKHPPPRFPKKSAKKGAPLRCPLLGKEGVEQRRRAGFQSVAPHIVQPKADQEEGSATGPFAVRLVVVVVVVLFAARAKGKRGGAPHLAGKSEAARESRSSLITVASKRSPLGRGCCILVSGRVLEDALFCFVLIGGARSGEGARSFALGSSGRPHGATTLRRTWLCFGKRIVWKLRLCLSLCGRLQGRALEEHV
jgi:hypothetical protein